MKRRKKAISYDYNAKKERREFTRIHAVYELF